MSGSKQVAERRADFSHSIIGAVVGLFSALLIAEAFGVGGLIRRTTRQWGISLYMPLFLSLLFLALLIFSSSRSNLSWNQLVLCVVLALVAGTALGYLAYWAATVAGRGGIDRLASTFQVAPLEALMLPAMLAVFPLMGWLYCSVACVATFIALKFFEHHSLRGY